MKKIVYLFSLSFLLICINAFSQENKEWDEVKRAMTKENDGFNGYDKIQIKGSCDLSTYKKVQTEFMEAVDILKPIESGKYPKQVKYLYSILYTDLAILSYNYNPDSKAKYSEAKEYIEKAFNYRNSLNSIPYEDAKYVDNATDFKNTFTDQIYFAYIIYYKNKQHQKSNEYANEYIMLLKGLRGEKYMKEIVEGKSKKDTALSLEYERLDYIYKYLPQDYSKNSQKEEAVKAYVDKLEFEIQKDNFKINKIDEEEDDDYDLWAFLYETPEEVYKKIVDSLYALTVYPGNYDKSGEQLTRAMNDFNDKKKYKEALTLAKAVTNKKTPDVTFDWKYAEIAYNVSLNENDKKKAGDHTPNGKEELRKALKLLEDNSTYFGTSEWDKMKFYYDYLGDKEGIARIDKLKKNKLKQQRRASFRNNFGVSISTNPFLIGITGTRQIPLGLDIRTGVMTNGFRLNLMNGIKDEWHFGNWKTAKTDDGSTADHLPNHYSGYEFSYAMKFRTKKESHSGCELRYANYTFDPIAMSVMNKSTELVTNDTVALKARRYDFTINTDMIYRKSIFFLDMYFGFGIGYKFYDFGDKYNMKDYSFSDYRYSERNLKHIYLPVRAGFRIGFNFI